MADPNLYFDNAATTFPKPESVYGAMESFARQAMGNAGRAGHRGSTEALRVLDRCRAALCRLFHGPARERFIFTLNATDALNLAIKGTVRPGDHVVTGSLEHNSVIRPLAGLAQAGVIEWTIVDCDSTGRYRPEQVDAAIRPTTRLVALAHVSNVLGTVQPIEGIGALCRKRGPLFLVDAAQSAGSVPIDLSKQPVDLLAAPGHKALLGPPGTGFLFVGERAEVRPWREGGTGSHSSDPIQPADLPDRLEAGTANSLGIAGLLAGVEFVESLGPEECGRRELALAQRLAQGLEKLPGLERKGPADGRLVNFVADSFPPAELAAILDEHFGVAVRAGLHCAPGAHCFLGTATEGTVRASPGVFQQDSDVDRFLEALSEMQAELAP